MTVYLAWFTDDWIFSPYVVGVYATKAGAYGALKQQVYATIREHQAQFPRKDMRNDYEVTWWIQTTEAQP